MSALPVVTILETFPFLLLRIKRSGQNIQIAHEAASARSWGSSLEASSGTPAP
jgi:hypothetical protein